MDKSILGTRIVTQVGILVNDIENPVRILPIFWAWKIRGIA